MAWLGRAGTGAHRLGLRGRVTLGFGALALVPSVLLAVAVWTLASTFLLQQREAAALARAEVNAGALQRGLTAGQAPVPQLLADLPAADAASSLVSYRGQWYASTLAVGPQTLPVALRESVRHGLAAQQRISIGGAPRLAVGIPLPAVDGAYFALFPLEELDQTYRVLSITLGCAAAATALLGIGAGRVASRRALRPLAEMTDAAAAVARGELDVRLPSSGDPDLAALAVPFNETADALRRRVVADARFAGDVSHELRTPLTTMLNSVQLLRNRRDDLPDAMREVVDLLADDLDRFRRMVSDLLEISRDDSGDGDGAREQVRLGELVRHAADGVTGRPVTTVEDAAEPLQLEVDKRRLAQVITNLVENAEQHGGGTCEVRVAALDGMVRITVDDAGPGVPAELRDRIFERFARTGSGSRPGVGLGLAIVERHTRWHGGSVSVEDRPGGGARFVVELPT